MLCFLIKGERREKDKRWCRGRGKRGKSSQLKSARWHAQALKIVVIHACCALFQAVSFCGVIPYHEARRRLEENKERIRMSNRCDAKSFSEWIKRRYEVRMQE